MAAIGVEKELSESTGGIYIYIYIYMDTDVYIRSL